MGISRISALFVHFSVLILLSCVQVHSQANTGPEAQRPDVGCPTSLSGNITINLETGGEQSGRVVLPCQVNSSNWLLKIKFDQFPFDCKPNHSFVKHTSSIGYLPINFCKNGTSGSNISTILDNNNEATIAVLNPDIDITITYVHKAQTPQDLDVLDELTVFYEFTYCNYGVIGSKCKSPPATSTQSTTLSTTSPSTTTSTSTTTTMSTTTTTTTTVASTSTTPTVTTTQPTTPTTPVTTTVTKEYDGTFCLGTQDPYPGSHIVWSDTAIRNTDIKPCPLQAEGLATRRCIDNSLTSENHAEWDLPDLSQCVSPFFKHTLELANSLLENSTVQPESIIDITSGMKNATGNDIKNILFAGDLTAAADTVGVLADLLLKSDPGRSDLHNITKGCSEVVSNIVDTSKVGVWKFSRDGYIEKKVTKILETVEQLSTNVAKQFSKLMTSERRKRAAENEARSENATVSVENLELSVHVIDRAENFSWFADKQAYGDPENGIFLPNDIFKNAVQGTSDPYIHLYYAKFPSIANLVTSTNTEINGPRRLLEPYINSDVLASKVLNADQVLFKSLKSSVKITFSIKNTSEALLVPRCVFLNMSAMNKTDRWSHAGCIRSDVESDENNTVCYCNHLTNFAVLMDIYDVETSIDEFDAKILTYLSYGGGTLSILGCCISIIVFEFFRLKNQRVRIHEQLALTIILVQVFFLVGIDRTENKIVCKVLAICLHYVLVAMFCWMLVEGAHLYLVLVKVFKSQSNMKKYVLIGWGVPFVIVGISAGIFHDDYGTGAVCWLTHKVLLVAFIPAVSLVIVINSVVLIVVIRIMFKSMEKGSKSAVEERSSVKSGLKAACVLLPLLGITWVFGYLSITKKETLIFTYLFTFFNSMQGVFFFVFHCLLSVDVSMVYCQVQNAYERHSRRRSQLRLTESSFSKRTRKGSEYDSSDYSGGFRESVKTNTTSAYSSLDRRVSNHTVEQNGISRPHSVSFEDDVFIWPQESPIDKLHRRTSSSSTKQLNDVTPRRNILNGDTTSYEMNTVHNGHVMNNVFRGIRQNSESSDGYVLYYGNNTAAKQNGVQTYSAYDGNDLYAKVMK